MLVLARPSRSEHTRDHGRSRIESCSADQEYPMSDEVAPTESCDFVSPIEHFLIPQVRHQGVPPIASTRFASPRSLNPPRFVVRPNAAMAAPPSSIKHHILCFVE